MTNCLKGQRIMKTATLTILRRLLAMALGAMGLGALAAGSANAQEIPAPNLFDGQVACSMNVPTPPMSLVGRNQDGDLIGISAKVMSGMTIAVNADGTADTDDDLIPTGADAALADILYVIDPNLGNCGAGYVMDADGNFLDSDGNTTTDSTAYVPVAIDAGIAADVGAGYTATLTAFQAVVAADTDVEAKQAALNALLEDDIDDDIQTAAIATAREALTTSQGEQTKAHTALYEVTGPDRDGSIYRAGVAEWRAKGAVESAISAWNTAVNELMTADDALTNSSSTFANYVPLQNSSTTAGQILSLIADPADAESAPNLANLRTYANAEGGSESTQDTMTGTITGSSNFDAAGNLLIPLSDADSDVATPLTQTTSAQTYSVVNTQLTQVNNVVTALEKLQSENKNALLQGTIDEAVRRAKLEQAHFQAQFDKLVADNTDLDTGTDGVQSFKTMYDAVRTAMTKRDNAGVTLETAVQTREAATAAVRAAFTSPQSFYQQLVDRRQYVKDQADAEVTRLAGLTGDDAPTTKQTEDAAKAATDAQTALETAQATHASFQDLIADDSPVKDLVLETLKPDSGMGQGDDGGKLVDAIDGAYDAAEEAQTTADNAETAATTAGNAVAALIAVDDPETTDVDETGRITALEAQVSGITGDSGQVAQNTTEIGLIDGRVADNEDAIIGLTAEDDPATEDVDESGAITKAMAAAAAGDEATLAAANAAAEAGIAGLTAEDDPATEDVDESGAITKAMAAAAAGDEATLAAANAAAEAGDEATLAAANAAAEAGDEATLAAANAAAEAGDEATLASANATSAAGDEAEAAARMAADEAEAAARMAADSAEAEARMAADMALGVRIDNEASTRAEADSMLAEGVMANTTAISAEADARAAADTAEATARAAADAANAEAIMANAADITTNAGNIAANNMYIMANAGMIETNSMMIGANSAAIAANASRIDANAMAVRELREDMSGGIAAAMALAGMPEIGDRGFSVGGGSYDGESAIAVGVHFSGENSRFKAALTSGGGETGVSIGAGWSF